MDRMLVPDSTVFIALAKLRKLELLKELDIAMMTPAVYEEAVEGGRKINAGEVRDIEAALAEGWIQRRELSQAESNVANEIAHGSPLGRGEAESIALASSIDDGLLVVDDLQARAVARAMGVRHLGTAALLLQAHVRGILTYEELADSLRELTEVIWLSPAVVAEILKTAREALP